MANRISIPAWGRNNNNGNGHTNGNGQGTGNGQSNGNGHSNGNAPVDAPVPPPAFATAGRANRIEVTKDSDPYDVVLESVKDELKTGRLLSPAAYDNPTDDDYAVVMSNARRQVLSYNTN